MREYFFGNKDIKISQELAKRGFYGRLNGLLVVTHEEDIPISTIYDFDSINTVEEEYPLALELHKHLRAVFTQKDKNLNIIKPQFIYFVGIKEVDGEIPTESLEKLSTDSRFIYGVTFTKHTIALATWCATYPKNMMYWFGMLQEKEVTATEKSNKIRIFLDTSNQALNSMEAVKLLWSQSLEGVKFQTLEGATPDNLADGQVVELDTKGITAYRYVNGSGEVTSSLTSDSKTHVDTTFIMDSIKYLLANNMNKMFKENNVKSSNVRALVQIYSDKALDYAFADLEMIERNADNSPKYNVLIPEITGKIRDTRDLVGVRWKFIPNIPIESLDGTVEEVLSEVELNNNDLGGAF